MTAAVAQALHRPTWRSRTSVGVGAVAPLATLQFLQGLLDTTLGAGATAGIQALQKGDYAGAVRAVQAINLANVVLPAFGRAGVDVAADLTQLATSPSTGIPSIPVDGTVDSATSALAGLVGLWTGLQAAINAAAAPQATTPTQGTLPLHLVAAAGLLVVCLTTQALASRGLQGAVPTIFQAANVLSLNRALPVSGVYDAATEFALASILQSTGGGGTAPSPADVAALAILGLPTPPATVTPGLDIPGAPIPTVPGMTPTAANPAPPDPSTASGGGTTSTGTTTSGPAGSSATPWIVAGLLVAAAGGTAMVLHQRRKKSARSAMSATTVQMRRR